MQRGSDRAIFSLIKRVIGSRNRMATDVMSCSSAFTLELRHGVVRRLISFWLPAGER